MKVWSDDGFGPNHTQILPRSHTKIYCNGIQLMNCVMADDQARVAICAYIPSKLPKIWIPEGLEASILEGNKRLVYVRVEGDIVIDCDHKDLYYKTREKISPIVQDWIDDMNRIARL